MKNTTTTIPTILLKKVIHRDNEQLLLLFPFNNEIKYSLRTIGGYFWSKTLRGWYTQFSEQNINLLKNTLKDKVTFVLDSSIDDISTVKPTFKKDTLSLEKKQILKLYVKYLVGKKYSESTIKTYVSLIEDLFEYIKDAPILSISNCTVELFIKSVFVPRNYKEKTYTQFMSAIKLFKDFYPECALNSLEMKTLNLTGKSLMQTDKQNKNKGLSVNM